MASGKHYFDLACAKPKINWLSTSVCVKAINRSYRVNVMEILAFIVSLLLVLLLLMLLLVFLYLSFSCVSCCLQNNAAGFYDATECDIFVKRANGLVQKCANSEPERGLRRCT